MSLVRWSPMWDPFEEMEDAMRRMPALPGGLANAQGFVPSMDVYETKDAVVVEVPLAGIDPKDVDVSMEKGVLTVQGRNKQEREVDEKNYYRKEIRSGSFYRQISLPAPVKEEKIAAEFEEGMLRVTCPKAVPTQVKKVSVKIIKKEKK